MPEVKAPASAADEPSMSAADLDTAVPAATLPTTAPGATVEPPFVPLGQPIRRRLGRRIAALVVLALAALWLGVRTNVSYFRVTSDSMMPTLKVGERVAVDPSARSPKIGDIVVFHPPAGARPLNPLCGSPTEGSGYGAPCGEAVPGESHAVFIKRVVAGPGDTIAIVGGRALVNGRALDEPYAARCAGRSGCSFPEPVKVPAGDYYVLGDNRGVSDDSRYWGPVPVGWILGTAVHCTVFGTICHTRG
jgi:signal peptidase I